MFDHLNRSPMRVRGLWLGLLLCLASAIVTSAQAADDIPGILVVKSIDAPIYDQVVEALADTLQKICKPNCRARDLTTISRMDMLELPPADLVIPIGRLASLAVAEAGAEAAIYGLIPEQTWDEIISCCPGIHQRQATALFLDQPIARQLNLIKVVLPTARRIAVLFGNSSVRQRDRVQAAARRLGLELITRRVEDDSEVGPALEKMLDGVDALLALPDPNVYNRDTIYGVLLTTYRKGVPVFGYAKSLVDAGAVAAIYSSPQDVGHQLAEMAADYLGKHQPLPPPSEPKRFSVKINKRVMRSLGLPVLSEDEVRRSLLELEQ